MENLSKKVYQMFIMGAEGVDFEKEINLKSALNKGLGGVIFFTRNILSVEQTRDFINKIKSNSKNYPFLAIDEEGGRVERTENIFGGKKFLSAKYATEKGEDFLKFQTEEISNLLNSMGFNLNFAPCVDVNTNPNNPIIGERAFSSSVDEVIKYGKIVTETYLKNNIIPCLKHFPGHGDADADSHKVLPVLDMSLDEMEKYHIKPFKEINSPMIMVAHLHCKAFDSDVIPSSLSKNVLLYLKNKIGFDGLIISDDMVMGGVVNGANPVESAIKAIKAGVNILLYRFSDDETLNIVEEVIKEAKKDSLLADCVEYSYNKILKLKSDFFTLCKQM
ncbi:MAG: hypothetical protein MJ229_03415 [bacterium]|nr:hypothetical protein [bacterium]